MAAAHSFDVVSRIDMQEVDNAFNQTLKEMHTRYDFKGSKSSIELRPKEREIVILAEDEFRRRAILDMLENKLVRRSVPLKGLVYGQPADAAQGMVRQTISLQTGIDTEQARRIVRMIKDMKRKVQAAIQEDQVRVTAAKIDDLQEVIAMLREADLPFDTQFVNYR